MSPMSLLGVCLMGPGAIVAHLLHVAPASGSASMAYTSFLVFANAVVGAILATVIVVLRKRFQNWRSK